MNFVNKKVSATSINIKSHVDPKKWPLLTGGSCSEVIYVMVVVIERWSLLRGGR